MPDASITYYNLHAVLPGVLTVLETDLPAELVTAGLPAMSSWRIGEPTMIEDEAWPTCMVSAQMSGRAYRGGRVIEPTTALTIFCGFSYTGTNDGYVDGIHMAELALKVMLANDDNPPLWEMINLNNIVVAPGWEVGKWQGGIATLRPVGPDVIWT